MRLDWTDEAEADLDTLIDYIAERNPGAAVRLAERIRDLTERLTAFPYSARIGRVPGTRELIAHPNYLVIYKVEENAVRILAVLHVRQRYP